MVNVGRSRSRWFGWTWQRPCHVSGTWVASVLEELGDYFGGEAFGVLGLVEERREEERFRARSGNLAKLPDAVGGRAGEDSLLAALVRQGARDRP